MRGTIYSERDGTIDRDSMSGGRAIVVCQVCHGGNTWDNFGSPGTNYNKSPSNYQCDNSRQISKSLTNKAIANLSIVTMPVIGREFVVICPR